jgi:tetratricopeptide (TPR) repeat protein
VSRLFISHSSRNDDWAIALRDWLLREGWSAETDIFLDLDPERGIVAGQRWAQALEEAATRCEAVLFLVSEAWLSSKWCADEYQLANRLNKRLFALLIDDVPLERLPGGLAAQWQVVNLRGEPSERFLVVDPRTQLPSPVHMARSGLASLKRGLEKAGIGAETFELQPDPNGPFGWRAAYRGLEALEPQDAAVFFGRNADLVRGIDALRGLAARRPPRLLVILGASGAGKSSFLRAGLWPRLARDDSQWLPMKAIRAGRGGAIEGGEGLLTALEDVHARFALRTTRAALRAAVAAPVPFVALLRALRRAAARRAHLDQPPYPLPILCLDQGEELFGADAGPESVRLLSLARAAIEADEALLLVTIRSDAYGLMQVAPALSRIDQVPLSLGPVPLGEIGRIIREPGELLRRKAGPQAPAFDPAVVERLQQEIAGEADALPLLAFVLQRLMREYAGQAVIGIEDLEQTGGVAAAIEREAEDALRRLFIPRLARIDRDSKAPQRRVAYQRDLASDLAPLARALTERRLLVARLADVAEHEEAEAATLEVAHEAMLRRWPTLADLLAEDRDALLMLDGVLIAATDWGKAAAAHKHDFLAHRGSRLADALALATRGADWAREIAPAQVYLAACQERESAEQRDKEAAAVRERARQRRALFWSSSAAAVLLVLTIGATVAGVFAYRAQQAALAQKNRAEQTLEAATKTANGLVFGLAQRFRHTVGVPAALVKDILDRALSLQSQLNASGQATPALRRLEAAALNESVDVLLSIGDTAGALTAAQRAQEIVEALLLTDPTNTAWQRDLLMSFNKVGDALMAAGKREEALAAYQKRLAIAQQLADSNKDNADWQRDLSVSFEKIGDALRAAGKREEALATYQKGHAITQRLADSNKGNANWQNSLSISFIKLGDMLMLAGKRGEALAEYQKSLAIVQQLADSNKGNADWQRGLSISLDSVGDALLAAGKTEEALAAYQKSLAICRQLADSDKGNAEWQRELSFSFNRVGDVLLAASKSGEALAAYQNGLSIAQQLAENNKGNFGFQAHLSDNFEKVGDALMAADRREEALAAYGKSLAIAQQLTDGNKGVAARMQLLVIFDKVGDALLAAGRHEEALAAYQKSLSITQQLADGDKSNTLWRSGLSESFAKIGDALWAAGKREQALAAYQKSLGIAEQLADSEGNAARQRELAVSLTKVGGALTAAGQREEALAAYQKSLAIVQQLADSDKGNAQRQQDLQFVVQQIGSLAYLFVLARDFNKALSVADQAIALAPNETWLYTNRAHALMFLGRVDEARTLYLQNRGAQNVQEEKSWERVILEDFAELRKAGLTYPLMDEIEAKFAVRG